IGIALSEIGVGGEEVTTLSLISEDLSSKERGKYLVVVPNMSNIGGAAIAFVFLYFNSSALSVQKGYFIVMAFAAIILAVFTRMSVPESYRWLGVKGKTEESAEEKKKLSITDDGVTIRQPNFYFSLIFLGIIGVSQYLTFGLMAYIIGPFYFSQDPIFISEIIFYASVGASIAGFVAIFVVEWGRKKLAMFSFWGGTAIMIVILLLMNYISDVYIFIPLLLLNMAFSEFAWATRTTLEPELFRTSYRSTAIGLVRIFPIIAYIISIYATSSFTLQQYLTFNVILWVIGGIASLVWYLKGIETRGINIDYRKITAKS
ncbi:MAG: MFS transporter, partial [Thermoplasmata archaeon]